MLIAIFELHILYIQCQTELGLQNISKAHPQLRPALRGSYMAPCLARPPTVQPYPPPPVVGRLRNQQPALTNHPLLSRHGMTPPRRERTIRWSAVRQTRRHRAENAQITLTQPLVRQRANIALRQVWGNYRLGLICIGKGLLPFCVQAFHLLEVLRAPYLALGQERGETCISASSVSQRDLALPPGRVDIYLYRLIVNNPPHSLAFLYLINKYRNDAWCIQCIAPLPPCGLTARTCKPTSRRSIPLITQQVRHIYAPWSKGALE
jgi:hypothetical protein